MKNPSIINFLKNARAWKWDQCWRNGLAYPVYFQHPKLRITIFSEGPLNEPRLRWPNEVIIVRDSWYPNNLAQNLRYFYKKYQPNPKRIIFLSNTEEMHKERLHLGMNSHYVNIGCFIDENTFTPSSLEVQKVYDAVMTARFSINNVKRHELTRKINHLALLDPFYYGDNPSARAYYISHNNCSFYNNERLLPEDLVKILHQSHCGLALSRVEGICRASSEYLLSGLSVVSTHSHGGRDVWYDKYNSLIVDTNEDQIAAAVAEFKAKPRDPWRIKNRYIELAQVFRQRFHDEVLTPILKQYQIDLSAQEVMQIRPFPWWGKTRKEFLWHRLSTRKI